MGPRPIEPEASALLSRADGLTRSLARRSEAAAAEAAGHLRAAGHAAVAEPVPTRTQYVSASLSTSAGRDEATAVLAADGYRVQHLATATAATVIRTDAATTRLHVRSSTGGDATADGDDRDDGPGNGRAAGGVFLGTPDGVGAAVLALARPGVDDVVADVGCGDGRVVVAAAERFGCRAVGVEHDPELAELARQRAATSPAADRIEIVAADAAALDLSGVTVAFLFLPPDVVRSVLPAVLSGLAPGARVVAHEQLPIEWPVEPTERHLVLADDGVTIGHLWHVDHDLP